MSNIEGHQCNVNFLKLALRLLKTLKKCKIEFIPDAGKNERCFQRREKNSALRGFQVVSLLSGKTKVYSNPCY